MGTAKRERQKANRQIRLEQLAKQARHRKGKRLIGRLGALLLVVVAIVGLVFWLGNDDNASTATTTTTVPADGGSTTVVDTVPAIDKPEVSLPTTPVTELKVTELTPGTGPAANTGDTVRVFYVGVLSADGSEFDTNYGGTRTFDLTLGGGEVISGWDQGLAGTKAGGRYQLDIPSALAYGATGSASGSIPPNADLTFVVDVVAVTPAG